MGPETLNEVAPRMARCCLTGREEVHVEVHCCLIGHVEVLACEATSGGVLGS